jgi:hypothetical protein
MATFGTVDVMVKVDSRRVIDIIQAFSMLCDILTRQGYVLTDDEAAVVARAVESLKLRNLLAEAS